ncbi:MULTISPECIES: DUF4129 domain-containing protein [Aequorivita]|uniref:DUF4129 domain-containing protein n=2 Tax=Aequorivita TaxID=153265 RepID=A0AB35YS86_9FLAO|nr:DUF4129 domain-containing protein [Aequorivita sp. Ant34-E75]WGF91766.1 DUF4129 domain-containing protein [Aequorivita sp. Ant34-E75]
MYKPVFIFLCLLFAIFSQAAPIVQDSVSQKIEKEIHYDTTENLKPPIFSSEIIEKYKSESTFDYTEQIASENWWTQFKSWIWQLWLKFWKWLVGDFEAGGFVSFLVHMLPYLIIFAIVVFVIWLFYKLNPGASFFKSKEKPDVFLSEEEKIIKSKNIKQLIEKALADKNYRLAVRYYYLLILKKLTEAELINYEFDKTNSEYFAEITSEEINFGFKKATLLYDYIWYGNFAVTEENYLKAQKTFVSLENQIPESID